MSDFIIESQNYIMVWVGKDFKDDPAPTQALWAQLALNIDIFCPHCLKSAILWLHKMSPEGAFSVASFKGRNKAAVNYSVQHRPAFLSL